VPFEHCYSTRLQALPYGSYKQAAAAPWKSGTTEAWNTVEERRFSAALTL
jgi:hypothetical protein